MAFSKAERRESADLIQRPVDLVDDRHLSVADGPAGVALARHLEGVMLVLLDCACWGDSTEYHAVPNGPRRLSGHSRRPSR